MSHFNSPGELLNYVKIAEAKSFLGKIPDAEFQRISARQLEELDATLPNGDPYDWLVEQLMAEALHTLSPAQRADFQAHVAAGCLDHASFNARIISDRHANYAIILNKGLMLLLNKFLKLVAAAKEPSDVIYCNRGDYSTFASEDYLSMGDEVMACYAKTGEPKGPRIKFRVNSECAVFVAINLRWVELFIFCHELGHYINGDLQDSSKFVSWELDKSISAFYNSSSHECEFAADRFAFRQLLGIAARDTPSLPSLALVAPLVLIFDILRSVSDRESYTHPAPSVRLLTLIGEFFGKDAALIVGKSLSDLAVIHEIEAAIGNATVSQLLKRTRPLSRAEHHR
jgi:hypothetical protein